MQTATVHTVQHWQDFTWVKQWHPRHLNSCLRLHWEAAYTSALLLLLAFYQSLQRPWKPFNKFKKKKEPLPFFQLNVGAMSLSQSVGSVQLVQKEQGSVGDISVTLFHSLSVFNFTSSRSVSLSLTKPGCDDSVTALKKWINKKIKKERPHFEVVIWGSYQGGQSGGGFVRNESMCVNVCQLVNVWCTLQSDRWWAEGGERKKFKNGVTDGLIAEAGLSHKWYEKRS